MTTTYIVGMLTFVAPCFFVLFASFSDQVRLPKLSTAVAAMIAFLAIAFLSSEFYTHKDTFSLLQVLISTATLLAGVVIFKLVVSYSFAQCLFAAAIAKCYSDNVVLFTSAVYFFYKGAPQKRISDEALPLYIGITLLTMPFVYLLFKKILRPVLDSTKSLSFWRFLWMIPICVNTLYTLAIEPKYSSSAQLSGEGLYLLPYVWTILSFSIYIIILKMISEVTANARLQEKLHISETQISAQQKQTEALQQRIEENRKIRHDFRHQILAMQGYAANRDFEALEEYFNTFLSSLEPEKQIIYCEDTAINAMLCYYADLARAEDIKMDLYIKLPDVLPFTIMDLCIILGNLLENAVEACKRQPTGPRFISIRMTMISNYILTIIVKNSYEGLIRQAGKDFLSSKKKGRKGIGISSVIDITEKYNGVPRFEYDSHVFKASLLLNGEQKKKTD